MNRQLIDRGMFSLTLTLAALCGCGADVSGPADPNQQVLQGDEAAADSSSAASVPFFTRTLPDNTFLVCPLPWALTGYGRVGQCTAKITGPWGTFGRVGFYNRDFDLFEPASEWRPDKFSYPEMGLDYDHFLVRGTTPERVLGPWLGRELAVVGHEGHLWLVRRR